MPECCSFADPGPPIGLTSQFPLHHRTSAEGNKGIAVTGKVGASTCVRAHVLGGVDGLSLSLHYEFAMSEA
eukprot:scaffold316939_cov22-Tisochrysis_lutea.AAC.1